MSDAADKLRALWAQNETEAEEIVIDDIAPGLWEELQFARESALLHAKALDETKRDLERARRRMRGLEDQNREFRRRLEAAEFVSKYGVIP